MTNPRRSLSSTKREVGICLWVTGNEMGVVHWELGQESGGCLAEHGIHEGDTAPGKMLIKAEYRSFSSLWDPLDL